MINPVMKKLLLLFNLLFSGMAYSQNYYTGDTAQGQYVTYKCILEKLGQKLLINSKNCSRIRRQPLCKNGQEAVPGYWKVARINDIDYSILKSIFKDVLTAEKLAELKEKECRLLIPIVIEPNGRIAEVGFVISKIPKNSLLFSITPDVYYQIEQQIKSKIWFTLDEHTRDTYQWISELMGISFKDLE